jgi:ribose transport system substrate-binding protein
MMHLLGMTPPKAARATSAAALSGLLVLAAAACSSSGGNNQASGAPSGSASASGSSNCVATAKNDVASATAPLQFNVPQTPVKMNLAQGKSVWFVANDENESLISSIEKGVQQAGAAAGLKVVNFDGQGAATTENQGVSEAVAQHADAIILQGITPSIVSGPLAEAFDAHIPVIDSFNSSPDDPLNGLYAHVTANFRQYGQLEADFALAQTDCKLNLEAFTSTTFQSLVEAAAGIKQEVSKLCGSSCSTEFYNVAPTDLATAVGPLVTTSLARNPKTNFMLATYDGIGSYMVPALQEIGSSVETMSQTGEQQDLQYVAQGTLTADLSYPPLQYIGWAEIDEVGRALAGQPAVTENLPAQLFTKSNINIQNPFPSFGNYESAFEKLWGRS